MTSAKQEQSASRPQRPILVVFDVNETLSDMTPLSTAFADVGAAPTLAATWFTGLLRDAFALTVAGVSESFATLASESLRVRLEGESLDRPVESAVEHVMQAFAGLAVHPDVADGVRALSDQGLRLVTLSNGSAAVADALMERAGVRDRFERLLSVEQAGIWKPARGAYDYALAQCDVEAADAMLVAVHPWDVDGALRAGLAAVWLNRSGTSYPAYFTPPDLEVASLDDLAAALAEWPQLE